MPLSSIKIGIDLDAVKPVPGCITFKGDITDEAIVAKTRNELKHFEADAVLNDGAPNVGA